jgi:hypothetical protein
MVCVEAGAGDSITARNGNVIIVRVIKPATPFKSSVFREEIVNAVKVIEKDAVADFNKTVATWVHKPKFKSEIKTTGSQSVTLTIVPEPEKPYLFLDKGTKVRYATMSPDWKSKTEPNVAQAFLGKGKRLFVSKKHPRPGIKARNFTKHIAKTYKTELQRETKNALARAARRSGHGVK